MELRGEPSVPRGRGLLVPLALAGAQHPGVPAVLVEALAALSGASEALQHTTVQ